jgi:hypothetical protein
MFEKKRHPKIRPPSKMLDKFLEAIAIATMSFGIIFVCLAWSSLPPIIPIHFDAVGNADGFGSKGMIWLLPAISVVMVPGMLFLRRFPWLSNVPIAITEENAEYQYGLIVRLLSVLSCVVSLLFSVLLYDTVEIAKGGSSLLGWMFMPIFIGSIFAPIIWYFIAVLKGR